ncbi:hypothetical protein DAI22_12g167300 [Oryza sativa Japonica Group]|nr:hypothetical protein DAI22_12g167300 [Oryza sativa Japonica Group]
MTRNRGQKRYHLLRVAVEVGGEDSIMHVSDQSYQVVAYIHPICRGFFPVGHTNGSHQKQFYCTQGH